MPRRTQLTPVQRLNRDGVDAIKKHEYERAGVLFYKAYLYDPADPFTLNNLGYISELQGQLDRARPVLRSGTETKLQCRYRSEQCQRPRRQADEGGLDRSRRRADASEPHEHGRHAAFARDNRGFDATGVLRAALALDRNNAFTLNNLGVAHEAIGDYDNALRFYNHAADQHSTEPVVVTLNEEWRGRPVSKMAAESARRLARGTSRTWIRPKHGR